jgi:hypothetical protein
VVPITLGGHGTLGFTAASRASAPAVAATAVHPDATN